MVFVDDCKCTLRSVADCKCTLWCLLLTVSVLGGVCCCRLSVLAQRGEISLVEKAKKETQAGPSPTSSKPKKTQRIKALSPKMQRDEQLEVRKKGHSFFYLNCSDASIDTKKENRKG